MLDFEDPKHQSSTFYSYLFISIIKLNTFLEQLVNFFYEVITFRDSAVTQYDVIYYYYEYSRRSILYNLLRSEQKDVCFRGSRCVGSTRSSGLFTDALVCLSQLKRPAV